jgi:hypothetical protein
MLHGFSVPLTPQGNSALVSPPPWHYSSDCIVVEYWTDPAAITAVAARSDAGREGSGSGVLLVSRLAVHGLE